MSDYDRSRSELEHWFRHRMSSARSYEEEAHVRREYEHELRSLDDRARGRSYTRHDRYPGEMDQFRDAGRAQRDAMKQMAPPPPSLSEKAAMLQFMNSTVTSDTYSLGKSSAGVRLRDLGSEKFSREIRDDIPIHTQLRNITDEWLKDWRVPAT